MANDSRYSVVIADDHMLVRQATRSMLTSVPFDVVAEAGDGLSAVALVKQHRPDLLVLDIAMPHATGVEVIEEARRWSPDTKIAVVTGLKSPGLLSHVSDAGVEGLFLKSGDTSFWSQTMVDICAGKRWIDPTALAIIEAHRAADDLSGRERQVLFGIARGETNAAIAAQLGISPSTVDKHRTRIMRKLGVHSAAELLARALRDGLLDSTAHV